VTALEGLLERNGFVVNRSDCCMQEGQSMMVFELLVDRMPLVRRHPGPPVWEKDNAVKFFTKERPRLHSGPFIEGEIYVVEIDRRHTHARTLLSSAEILETGLGKHVKLSLEEGWETREGTACWQEDFSSFLGGFLRRLSPLMRIRKKEDNA
jgi:tRNA nucleotidyltransferase (CCA-adding enzyme)